MGVRKVAFLFPGQASQRIGMLKDSYREIKVVQDTFEEASDSLGYSVPSICFNGSKENMLDITKSAPIILTAAVASFRHLAEMGIEPSIMAGHSLGEYSALTCSGVFTFEEALSLVTFRSEVAKRVAEEKQGTMTVIFNVDQHEVESVCKELRLEGGKVWVGCYNSKNQISIAGKEEDIVMMEQRIASTGANYKRIHGNAPFHSPMLEDVTEELADKISSCQINNLGCPVISNFSVKPYTKDQIIENLIQQIIKPVQWSRTIDYLVRQNTDLFIELGSGQTLTRLNQSMDLDLDSLNYERIWSQADALDGVGTS